MTIETRELQELTKKRMKLSVCLIMIIEYEKVHLDELIQLTGYTFNEINSITNNLVRLKLIEVQPTESLPMFLIRNPDEARSYLKLLEENLYLDELQ